MRVGVAALRPARQDRPGSIAGCAGARLVTGGGSFPWLRRVDGSLDVFGTAPSWEGGQFT
jgi:hypothetical protein